jgi:regulatory protein RepA
MKNQTKTTCIPKTTRRGSSRTGTTAAGKRSGKKAAVSADTTSARVNRIDAATVSTADLLKGRAQPLDFVLPCFLLGTVGQVVASGGVGKSFFALQNGISISVGKDVFGFWGDDNAPFKMKKGRVLYISAEDGRDIVRQRLQDACRGLTRAQRRAVLQNLELVFPSDFSIVKKVNGALVPSTWVGDLRASLAKRREKPRLIIIDTLNRSLGDANENNASSMGTIQDVLKGVAETFRSSVLLLHHTVKGTGDNESGLRQDAARGSGASSANCRWQANMILETSSEQADLLEGPQPDKIGYVISKANYGQKPGKRVLIRTKNGVLLGLAELEARNQVKRTRDHATADNQNAKPRKRVMPDASGLDADAASPMKLKSNRSR